MVPRVPFLSSLAGLLCLAQGSLQAQNFTLSPQAVPGHHTAALTWADYDQDGDLDLLISGARAEGHRIQLFRNEAGNFVPGPFEGVSGFTGATAWGDFDGDGDPDFASGGFSNFPGDSSFPPLRARIFRNDGNGVFTPLGTDLATSGVPIWADFDRDGDLDLLIAGADFEEAASSDLDVRRLRIFENEPGKPWRKVWERAMPANARLPLVEDSDHDGWPDLSYVYSRVDDVKRQVDLRNQGGFQFAAVEHDYSGLAWPYFTDWGDVDNDGDLDAAFTGELGFTRLLKLIRHDPDQYTSFDIPGVGGLALAWGDFDNDGLVDLVTTDGDGGDFASTLRLHRNTSAGGDPTFLAIDLPFRGAGHSTLSWADVDGDGDADLAITGLTNDLPSFRLLLNQATASNKPPVTPSALASQVGSEGHVQLSWSAATDANQSGGLTYNVRVGRRPGSVDVVAPDADPLTGRLWVPRRGNASSLLELPLHRLLAGTYFWSVQAVDHGFAASPFAAEAQFVIPPGPPRLREVTSAEVKYQHALLRGEVVANGAMSWAWFEYGLNDSPDLRTPVLEVGAGVNWTNVQQVLTELETARVYSFRFVISNAFGVVQSSLRSFQITNQPPTLTLATRVTTAPNSPAPLVNFTIGDLETTADLLTVKAEIQPTFGQNPKLLTPAGVQLGGAGETRTLRLTPEAEERGSVRVVVTVTDAHGAQAARGIELWVEDFTRGKSLGTDPGLVAAAFDIDGDGRMELGGSLRWFYNAGAAGLTSQTAAIQNSLTGPLAIGDADNDGDVDFAVSGTRSGSRFTQVFTNRAFTTPTTHVVRGLPTALFPGFADSTVRWADYDGDGDADLIVAGITNLQPLTAFTTQVWRNDGGLTFTPVVTSLPRLAEADLAWADFDGDGDLDVCFMGTTNRATSGSLTRIWRNDGAGLFVDIGAALPEMRRGTVAWGDVDNDGRLDLLLAGVQRLANNRTTNLVVLYRQEPAGTFVEAQRFDPLADAAVRLVDVNNDGRLDIFYVGTQLSLPLPENPRLYLNRPDGFHAAHPPADASGRPPVFGDFDGDGDLDWIDSAVYYVNNAGVPNTPPSAPTELRSSAEGDTVTFSWAAATDANQSGGHTYNLRVGRTPAGSEIVSALADPATGQRWVVEAGNAWDSLKWRIRGLSPGTYYWTVQAIDHAYAGGPFAPVQTLIVGAGPPQPEITAIRAGEQGRWVVTLRIRGAGRYALEASSDLAGWTALGSRDLAEGTPEWIVEPSELALRFFRLRAE